MKKQTFLICFENIDGIAVNFERWTFKSVKTCIKKTIELYKSYPDIYADTLNKTVKVIAYSTPQSVPATRAARLDSSSTSASVAL